MQINTLLIDVNPWKLGFLKEIQVYVSRENGIDLKTQHTDQLDHELKDYDVIFVNENSFCQDVSKLKKIISGGHLVIGISNEEESGFYKRLKIPFICSSGHDPKRAWKKIQAALKEHKKNAPD